MNIPSLIRLARPAALLTGAILSTAAYADDIDLYAGSAVSGDVPNVLIVLDSSANWSSSIPVGNCYYNNDDGTPSTDGPRATNPNKEQGTKMAIEKCALYNVINALPTGPGGSALFNVGIMLFNESPASNSGGYPRVALQPLTATAKATYKNAIRNLGINADKGNNAAFAKSLYEAFRYFKGQTPYKGTAGSKWDHAATVGGLSTGNYISSAAAGCGKNHIIFIANGGPGENTNAEAKDLLSASGGSTTQITYPTSYVANSDQANWADEFARFMFSGADVSSKDGSQSIQTHAVAVLGASSDGLYPNFMDSIAKYGGTGTAVRASDSATLARKLAEIFAQIQSVSSVFASASLPISVNARGTYLNQIFMGMFLPNADAKPRWDGNLKQYQFAYTQATDSLQLADSFGVPAIDGSSGFIKSTATSFWSHSSSFWSNSPSGVPLSISDAPDGAIVPKGAAAQILRDDFASSQDSRKVFTCIGCASGTELNSATSYSFENGNTAITTAMLGVATDADRTALINWTRGTDNLGDELGPGGAFTVRPSLHGDVLHSRPVAVNYGGSIGIVVYYGANDGMLHAVVGTQTGANAGKTLWSFLPSELLGRLKRQRSNTPLIAFPNVPAALSPTARDYFVDGPMSIYQKYNSDGSVDKVLLYVGMRRGGRMLYAFDVTNPNNPIFQWKKSDADIALLGQTWSEARVAKVRGHTNPVIIMGGGYDAVAEDASTPGIPTMGNTVVVLDAFDGTVLRSFTGVDRPVPADVALIDSDFDNYIDRAYAVDLGGNIYRIDFEPSGNAPTDWTLTKLADLGSSGGKKFFYQPDAVVTRNYTAVMVGSGDREKPLATASSDFFFTVIDPSVGKSVNAGFTAIDFASLANSNAYNSSLHKGCYLAMDTRGEKIVNAPLTVAGTTYFGTNMPAPVSANSCAANLGIAKSYAVPLMCQTPKATELNGGGLPPSPVAGIVSVVYSNPDGTTSERQMPFCIGCGAGGSSQAADAGGDADSKSAVGAQKVKFPVAPKRQRRYWFQEEGH